VSTCANFVAYFSFKFEGVKWTTDQSISIVIIIDRHISSICKSAFYHIRSLRHIRSAITDDMAKSVALSSLLPPGLCQLSSLRYYTKNINRLQRVQNTLARIVAGHAVQQDTHSSGILKHLHWIPTEQRIHFKLATLTHNTLLHSARLPSFPS